MTRFEFTLRGTDETRQMGVVQSESFSDALSLVTRNVRVQDGDTLEIGVAGFPPARYAFFASEAIDAINWRPIGLLAA